MTVLGDSHADLLPRLKEIRRCFKYNTKHHATLTKAIKAMENTERLIVSDLLEIKTMESCVKTILESSTGLLECLESRDKDTNETH